MLAFFVFESKLDKIVGPTTENPAHQLGESGFLVHL
jgi:hypothetical protein